MRSVFIHVISILFLAAYVSADAGGCWGGYKEYGMMGGYGGSYGMRAFVGILWIVFWALIIAAIVLVVVMIINGGVDRGWVLVEFSIADSFVHISCANKQ